MPEEKDEMTITEALAAGYIHYGDGEEFMAKLPITGDIDWEDMGAVYLVEKEGFKYQLSAQDISDLIGNHLESQDEVYDEMLGEDIPKEVYEQIAALLNPHFKTTYYNCSDIRLVPDKK